MAASDPSPQAPAIDPLVSRALAKWPNVPECHGWLGLDCRGRWRLQGTALHHANLVAFINRNYTRDERGRWLFQNGPQRVFVDLDYTPWVLRLGPDAVLATHTGRRVEAVHCAYLDDQGYLLLEFALGVGVTDPTDGDAWLGRLRDQAGAALADTEIEQRVATLIAGGQAALSIDTGVGRVAVQPIRRAEVAARFGFVPRPRPESA